MDSPMKQPHPQPFNRTSFITLNSNRLFTAKQVADLIKEHTHTPAAPATDYNEVALVRQMHEEYERGKADGAKAEREQARKDVANEIWEASHRLWDSSVVTDFGAMERKLESLRGGGAP